MHRSCIHYSKPSGKALFVLFFVCCHFIANSAIAQTPPLGLPVQAVSDAAEVKPNPVDGNELESQVEAFNDKALRFNISFTNTASNILIIYADPAQVERWKEQLNLVKSAGDSQMQAEVLRGVIPLLSIELQKLTSDPEFIARTQKLSAEAMKQLRSAVINVMLLTIQSRSIFDSGKKIISFADINPENLSKVIPVKDALPLLTASLTTLISYMPIISAALKSTANSAEGKASPN